MHRSCQISSEVCILPIPSCIPYVDSSLHHWTTATTHHLTMATRTSMPDRRPNDGTDATTILRCAAVDLTGILCTTHLLIPDFQRSAAASRPSSMTLQNFSTGSARRQTCSVQGLGCVQLVVQGSRTANVGSMSRKYELVGGIFCKMHQLGLTVSITIRWLQLSMCADDRSSRQKSARPSQQRR